MDKEIVERVRKSLTSIADTLQELNDYLTVLRQRTDEEIATLSRRTLAAQAAARVAPTKEYFITPGSGDAQPTQEFVPVQEGQPTVITMETNPTGDPRFPYTAGRQPRRDGDSFGRTSAELSQKAASHDNDPAGSVRPPGKR